MGPSSVIVGIDLGTTNSGVALVRNGAPEMLLNGDERIMPSVVSYLPAGGTPVSGTPVSGTPVGGTPAGGQRARGQWLVGTPARNQLLLNPEQTVRSIKRHMGTDYRVTLANRQFTPPEISAFILHELKEVAERNLGHEVRDAVITVPAYFPDAARQATRDAGRIAGLNVQRIINEPTAAALAYGLNMAEDQLVLVYDLGGGTFDVSLVELMGGIVEVRASHGNTRLGGDDFDDLLAAQIADRFLVQHGVDLREDRRAWARVIRAAEAAKIELSSHPYTLIGEEYVAQKRGVPLHLEDEISRDEFHGLVRGMLDGTLESIDRVLADARVARDEIDQVLLVGGSTRIPAVWELVAGYLDIEPHMSINPEEAVALGASVQAAIIAGQPIDAILVDVTPYSLGIAVAERRMGRIVTDRYQVLIRRNTTIPVTEEEVFSTLYPEQDTVQVEVYQGESRIASENTLLGQFRISGLEPEHAGELAKVTVQFDFDVNGILTVTARDRQTGRQEDITVEASHARLSESEIMAAQDWVYDNQPEGGAPILVSSPSPETNVLLERAQELLYAGTLSVESQARLQDLVAAIEEAQAAGSAARQEELLDTLLDLLFDLE